MKVNLRIWIMVLAVTLSVTACGDDDEKVTPQTPSVLPQETLTRYMGSYVYTDASGSVETLQNVTATLTDKGSNQIEITFSQANAPRLVWRKCS